MNTKVDQPSKTDGPPHPYLAELMAMKEQSLKELAKIENPHLYRFLWLRTFHQPIDLRISIGPNGTASLVIKMASGSGGYGIGQIVVDKSRDLSKRKVAAFLKYLDEADFWNIAPLDRSEMGCDGAQWTLEGLKEGKYHFVDRWCPEDGAFRKAALFLVKQSKLKIKEIY